MKWRERIEFAYNLEREQRNMISIIKMGGEEEALLEKKATLDYY